jgi:hypothetical protein
MSCSRADCRRRTRRAEREGGRSLADARGEKRARLGLEKGPGRPGELGERTAPRLIFGATEGLDRPMGERTAPRISPAETRRIFGEPDDELAMDAKGTATSRTRAWPTPNVASCFDWLPICALRSLTRCGTTPGGQDRDRSGHPRAGRGRWCWWRRFVRSPSALLRWTDPSAAWRMRRCPVPRGHLFMAMRRRSAKVSACRRRR